MGVSVVNALSESLTLTIGCNGKKYQQEYVLGEPQYPLKEIGESFVVACEEGTYAKK